jgi:L-ribulose-5-phosphate 4-epimerase
VANHGPFAWGATAMKAAENAAILEYIARIACITLSLNASASPVGPALHDKHFLRKHGANAYYGQKKD